jgi:hypothetical protein
MACQWQATIGLQIRLQPRKKYSPADRKIRDRIFHRFQLKSTAPVAFLATGNFTAAGCGDGAWKSFSVSSG